MNRRLLLSLVLALSCRAEDVQGIVFPFKDVSVASPVLQEVIDGMLVEEGAHVQEGQPIVQLRAEKESLQVEQYKKVVEQRQFTADGAEVLAKEKMMSKEAVLEKRTELELARINLRQAEVALKEKTIRAPLTGIVVKKWKESGESADRAEKLVDIVSIDQVYVEFFLDPKLLAAVKVDQAVPVRFPVLGEKKYAGKISFIDPRIDLTSARLRVKVLVENADHTIKPGMRGLADFDRLTAAR